MTRRPVHRIAAWLMAVLLTLVVLEPMRAHECPLHGQLALRQAADAAPMHHGGHGAPAQGAGDAMHHGSQPAHDDGPHQCDCLGDCGLTALVALTAPAAVQVAATTVVVAAAPLATGPVVVAPAAEHVLPFANGPPARV